MSYARNSRTGEVHRVIVERGRVRLSGEQCNLDDAKHLELIGDGEAWAAFRARPASWHFDCTFPEDEGAAV